MTYTLHGEEINLGDIVYDVSASRGVGQVILLSGAGIEVQFNNGPRATFNEMGVQRGKNRATLFWRDPIIVVPAKSERIWSAQRILAETTRRMLKEVSNGE